MNEPDFKEKRAFKRIEKHFILTYYDTKNPEQKFSATQLKNISRGGMSLVTDKAFKPGTILEIEIKSAFFASITHMHGKVLESHEHAKDIIYETRLQFINLSTQAEAVIKTAIEFFENRENNDE